MRLITAVLTLLFIVGCGTNLMVKPESSVEKPPPVAVDMVTPEPQSMLVRLPNWPTVVYQNGDAFVLLVVKDPATFIIPKELVFRDGERMITLPAVMPDKKPQ